MNITTTKNPLSDVDREEYARLKVVAHSGFAGFMVTGQAILTISDKRYYREEHSTFKEFMAAEFGISPSRAYQLCEAVEVVNSLPQNLSTIVDNEAKARALSDVPEAERPKKIRDAKRKAKAENRSVTAADLKPEPDPEPVPEAIRNDRAMLKAFGGTVPPVPTDDPIKEKLRQHQDDTFHAFKVAVGKLIADLPKNVDTFLFSEWLHSQANLISNRRDQTKNLAAYV